METLAFITSIIIIMTAYHIAATRKLRRDYADLIIERDELREKLDQATKNDYRVNGRFAKRPK